MKSWAGFSEITMSQDFIDARILSPQQQQQKAGTSWLPWGCAYTVHGASFCPPASTAPLVGSFTSDFCPPVNIGWTILRAPVAFVLPRHIQAVPWQAAASPGAEMRNRSAGGNFCLYQLKKLGDSQTYLFWTRGLTPICCVNSPPKLMFLYNLLSPSLHLWVSHFS